MRPAILFFCLIASDSAGLTLAQAAVAPSPPVRGETASQPIIGPGVKHNVASIEEVMREIHQLMHEGPLTPRQDTEVSNMMIRLGIMMQEMGSTQGEKLAKQHEQELQEIRRQIENIRQQLQKSK